MHGPVCHRRLPQSLLWTCVESWGPEPLLRVDGQSQYNTVVPVGGFYSDLKHKTLPDITGSTPVKPGWTCHRQAGILLALAKNQDFSRVQQPVNPNIMIFLHWYLRGFWRTYAITMSRLICRRHLGRLGELCGILAADRPFVCVVKVQ